MSVRQEKPRTEMLAYRGSTKEQGSEIVVSSRDRRCRRGLPEAGERFAAGSDTPFSLRTSARQLPGRPKTPAASSGTLCGRIYWLLWRSPALPQRDPETGLRWSIKVRPSDGKICR
jgi:hypothetical protein